MNWDHKEKEYLREVAEGSVPKIKDCATFTGIFTNAYKDDPVCMLQIGAAILMDKPLVLLVQRGTYVPKTLEKVCKGIFYFTDDSDVQEASRQMTEFIKQLHGTVQ